jgi:hypothetical protein
MSRRLLVVLALASAVAVPGVAWGAPASVVEYQIEFTPATGGLVVVATADPSAPLPVTVQIPAPVGATLLWSGELLGGDPGLDPVRQAVPKRVGDMNVYEMTLESGHIGQLELTVEPARVADGRAENTLSWTNPGTTDALVSLSVIFEAGATEIELTPAAVGAPLYNDVGVSLHPLGTTRVTAGTTLEIVASWSGGLTAGSPQAGPKVPVWLFAALGLAVGALVLVVVVDRVRAHGRAQRGEPGAWREAGSGMDADADADGESEEESEEESPDEAGRAVAPGDDVEQLDW